MYYPLPCLLVARGLQIGLESDEQIALFALWCSGSLFVFGRNPGHPRKK